MNLKTTLFFAILVIGGGLGWYFWQAKLPQETDSPTADFLLKELKPDALTRIEVRRGNQGFVLQRASAKEEWTLPGKWPARDREVDQLVKTITSLHSRFASFPHDDAKKALLQKEPLVLTIKLGDKEHTLTLVDEPADTNRFSRPTYLHLDKQAEVLRLAPGLVAALDRGEEYFRKRQLFPYERVAKEDSTEKTTLAAASVIRIEPAKEKAIEIVKTGDTWEMVKPVRDRVEPDAVKAILTFLPSLWAENLIDRGRSLEDLGLQPANLEVRVTRPGGGTLDLRIGNVSRYEVRKETKPGPPNQFGMPSEIPVDVKEEIRFAKLADHDQIFEIKAGKLEEVVPADPTKLRDPRLARFKSEEARRLEIEHAGENIVLAKTGDKGKETWKIESGSGIAAESSQVTELLGKLANLEATGANIIDTDEPAKYGLDKPLVKLTVVVEETKGADEPVTKKTYAFQLGTAKDDKAKVFVRVAGWSRVNSVEDSLLTLAQRPAVAYRTRRLIDGTTRDLTQIDIQRGGDSFSFVQIKNAWKLQEPVPAEVEAGKVSSLAADLASLEAVEFVSDNPSAADLDKVYGLTKSALQARIHFATKKNLTLAIGNKRQPKEDKGAPGASATGELKDKFGKDKEKDKEVKAEYYARLDNGPVFVIRKELRDSLDRDSLTYHSERLLDVAVGSLDEIAITKDGQKLRLKREGKVWKIVEPFAAAAAPKLVDILAEDVTKLKPQRCVAHSAKDPAAFGLDKPFLHLAVLEAAEEKSPPKSRALVIGAKVKDDKDKDASGRYAQLEGSQPVFILPESEIAFLDRKPLELLARDVLRLNPDQIDKVQVKGATSFTLERKKEGWQVVDSPAPMFAAELDKVEDLLQHFADLQAVKIIAFGPKVDWSSYGLDKPALTLSVFAKEAGKIPHTLALGKETELGQRYARLDDGQAAFVLAKVVARELEQTHLDFANLRLWKIESANVAGLTRQMPGNDLELTKKGAGWFLKDRPADLPTVQEVLRDLANLRAQRIAEFPAKNLANFGLDQPAAVISVKVDNAGKTSDHIIRFGKLAANGRYALVDKGDSVVVLPPELSRLLLGPAVNFGDHTLANLLMADQAILEQFGQQGQLRRKVVFTNMDGFWKMTEPIAADIDENALNDLARSLYRLRADEIVAEKADLKMYGLAPPQFKWELRSDTQNLILHVGTAEPGSEKAPRLYARLEDKTKKDMVFLLDPILSAKVQAEYRKRKPWDKFDPVMVERFSVQGKQSFELVKLGKDWIISGKVEKVNSKVVSDTLDTLERLEVVRYVADAKADLQLFGLVPPHLTVEAESATGKRTLLVGRAEGAGQRYYAALPGSDAVFILSESDARKILRPLAAYVEDAKK